MRAVAAESEALYSRPAVPRCLQKRKEQVGRRKRQPKRKHNPGLGQVAGPPLLCKSLYHQRQQKKSKKKKKLIFV